MNLVRLYSKHPLFFKFAFIFFLIAGDLIFYEKNIFICKNKTGILLIIAHRILSFLLVLTPFLFSVYRYHLLLVFFIVLLWIYNGKCVITKWHNDLCGIKEDHDNSFVTKLMNYLDIDLFYIPFVLLGLPIIYDIYMIYSGH
jgi:hypothetical protein